MITEKLILKKQSWHPPQLATLIEYWSKEKLSFLLGGSDLNREASHAEFLEALEKEFEGASPALIEKLEHFFKELDELRFSGRRFKEKIETNELFQRAKNVLNLLENQLISQSRDSTIEVD